MARRRREVDIKLDLGALLRKKARRHGNFAWYPGWAWILVPYFTKKYRYIGKKTMTHYGGLIDIHVFDKAVVYLIHHRRNKKLIESVVVYYKNPKEKYDFVDSMVSVNPRETMKKLEEKCKEKCKGSLRVLVCLRKPGDKAQPYCKVFHADAERHLSIYFDIVKPLLEILDEEAR